MNHRGGNVHANGNGRGQGFTLIALSPAALASVKPRFLARIEKVGMCLLWKGRPHPSGWSRIAVGSRAWSAARVSWLLAGKPLPLGARLFHACPAGHRRCMAPEHLSLTPPSGSIAGYPRPRRLDPAKVVALRKAAANGVPLATLAAKYHVSPMTVRHALHDTWRSVSA